MSLRFSSWFQPAEDSVVAGRVRQGKSPWSDAFHVLWSAWVFISPVFSPVGWNHTWLICTLLSYPLFLLIYARLLMCPARQRDLYAGLLMLLCAALLPWYPSGLSYFVFGCVMMRPSSRRRMWHYMALLLVLSSALVAWSLWLGYPWQMTVWMPFTVLSLGGMIGMQELDQQRDAVLRLSQDEVRRLATVAERERIGRDLHDLLGHTLSLVALKSDLAARLAQRDAAAARVEMEDVSRVARDALAQVRRAVSGIRSAELAAELASAKLLLESDGVFLDHHIACALLPPSVETVFAMVLREAATNVQRHAQARRVEVTVSSEGRQLLLRVQDDGRGGDLVPGTGLTSMRERVQALGGELRVTTAAGAGTCVQASVPMPAQDTLAVRTPPLSAPTP
ncbi:MAG: sensor histidine kinase [Pseudoxanthomonas sp.]